MEKQQARDPLVHRHDQKHQRLRRRCDYTLLRRAGRRQLVELAKISPSTFYTPQASDGYLDLGVPESLRKNVLLWTAEWPQVSTVVAWGLIYVS